MGNEGNSTKPYKLLGLRLRRLREMAGESLAEVSGAVEIDMDLLEKIEGGSVRPSEDILLLLISHFEISDEQADSLWDIAGFERLDAVPDAGKTVPTLVLAPDNRVIYTDMLQVSVNPYGLVLNFGQGQVSDSQPQLVARVGMSLDYAKKVLSILEASLEQAEPKSLPATTTRSPKKVVPEKSD